MRGILGGNVDIPIFGIEGSMSKLGEVGLYKTHLLLIQRLADEMHVMAGHYLKEVSSLGDAEPFVWSVLNMSKEIHGIADIDKIRDEVLEVGKQPVCEAPQAPNRRSLYPPDTE